MCLADMKKLYKDGADAVELEMITQKQFDKLMKPYTQWKNLHWKLKLAI